MDSFPTESFHLLIFTIPGFFLVWSYKDFGKSNKISDFEYLMFSLFWGLFMVAIFSSLVKKETIFPLLQNPYAGAITFSLLGIIIGWTGSKVRLKLKTYE